MWSLIGLLAIAALVLASCAGDGGNGGNGGNGEDEPQYGGTIVTRRIGWQMKGFDPLVWDNNNMNSIIFDRYFTAPWEKGPAGTGELGTLQSPFHPRSEYVGEYLESFEVVDLYHVNYKLREGIHYWDKAPVNGREMTVDDIMWNWLRDVFHPRAGTYMKSNPAAALTYWESYLQEIEDGIQPQQPLLDFLTGMREVTPQLETYYPGLEAKVRSDYAGSYALLAGAGYDVSTGIALLTGYMRKIDNYTFEAHGSRCSRTLWALPNAIWPTPREVTEVDEFNDWETVVGTGPWIPTSFEPSSEATYVRNPDYWQNDPVHPENQLPYADELNILMIEDESAYYAALQTAQLDIGYVEYYKVGFFKENSPDMLYYPGTNTGAQLIHIRNDIPPFNDVKVRHAAMLAIDHEAIFNDRYKGDAVWLSWPEQPYNTMVYTPFDQLPAETQELFLYDPDKAITLLAEAGYPAGFSTEMIVYPASESREVAQIVQDYLAHVNITVELRQVDAATHGAMLYGSTFETMILSVWYNDVPADAMFWAEGGALNSPYNFCQVVDPIAYETGLAIGCMLDDNAYYAAIKADDVRRLGMMYNILLPTPVGTSFLWPWLKNWHGEADLGYPDETGWGEIPKYLWIDQDLKDSMT